MNAWICEADKQLSHARYNNHESCSNYRCVCKRQKKNITTFQSERKTYVFNFVGMHCDLICIVMLFDRTNVITHKRCFWFACAVKPNAVTATREREQHENKRINFKYIIQEFRLSHLESESHCLLLLATVSFVFLTLLSVRIMRFAT